MSNQFVLKEKTFTSRLLLGTGKFASIEQMLNAIKTSRTELVTVALKRFNPENTEDDLFSPLLNLENITIVPNTSGARTAEEAVQAARLAREISGSCFVKVEIHPNPHHLLPDPIETYKACVTLAKDGFIVLPYMPPDPVLAKRLEECGCAAVMPLGSPIGSGKGLESDAMIKIIIENSRIPVICDAGIRSPSDAAYAMEIGCDAVLINSAIAASENPSLMASAFADAVDAGYNARKAGIMDSSDSAVASSPLTTFLTND